MLCFLIPLKSQLVSNNWQKVCRIFETTLLSTYNQIDPNFKIIVICHEKPHLQFTYDERVEIIQVDFPIPDKSQTKETMKDKWKKLGMGMIRAKEINPDFIMFVDADDLVSNKLSQYVNSHKEANGWILKKGYKYSYGSHWLNKDNDFNCGTNAIINSKLIRFPTTIEESEQCIILANGHTVIEAKMKELKTPLTPLPFPGAVYICNHGDNDSHSSKKFNWYGWRHFFKTLPNKRLLSLNVKQEFSF